MVQVVFRNLGIESRKKLEEGIKKGRIVPTKNDDGSHQTAIWDTFDYGLVEGDVQRVYGKIVKHEKDVGRYELDPTDFVPNPEWPEK